MKTNKCALALVIGLVQSGIAQASTIVWANNLPTSSNTAATSTLINGNSVDISVSNYRATPTLNPEAGSLPGFTTTSTIPVVTGLVGSLGGSPRTRATFNFAISNIVNPTGGDIFMLIGGMSPQLAGNAPFRGTLSGTGFNLSDVTVVDSFRYGLNSPTLRSPQFVSTFDPATGIVETSSISSGGETEALVLNLGALPTGSTVNLAMDTHTGDGVIFSVGQVPEPSTMLLSALGALGLLRRRR